MAKAFHLPIWEGEGSHPGALAPGSLLYRPIAVSTSMLGKHWHGALSIPTIHSALSSGKRQVEIPTAEYLFERRLPGMK